MDMLATSFFWVTLGQIIMINIVLSGDNAVVIAMASRVAAADAAEAGHPFRQLRRDRAAHRPDVLRGLPAALPYLKIIGAVLLLWIGIKMLLTDDEAERTSTATRSSGRPSRPSSSPTSS